MRIQSMKVTPKNVIMYLLGTIVIAFGVVMMYRSGLGMSSWDTLHYSLHALFGITVGTATIIVALTFTVFVTVLNRHFKFVLMTIPIFLVGILIDFFDLILLVEYLPSNLFEQMFTFLLGLTLLPMGGSLLIASTFPAGVFDEFMLVMMRVFKTNKMIQVRVIMELSAVTVAIILSFMAGEKYGMFNIGTLIFSLFVGIMIKTYLKFFEKIGLYNIEDSKLG